MCMDLSNIDICDNLIFSIGKKKQLKAGFGDDLYFRKIYPSAAIVLFRPM